MDPDSGKLYESIEAALKDGVTFPVELVGRPEDIQRISKAVKAQKKAKRTAQKTGRRNNRG